MDGLKEFFLKYKWRILLSAAGLVIAILWLCIGFFRMLLILILAMAGFMLGYKLDASESFKEFIERVIPERFRRPYE